MNPIEGQISIDWKLGSTEPEGVAIRSSRPLQASRIMLGKTPQQVLSMIPLMYKVCAIAQTHASIRSLSSDAGLALDPAVEQARDVLVLSETLREHLLRILMDWPELFDQPIDPADLPRISALPRDMAAALFEEGQAFAFDSHLRTDHEASLALLDRVKSILQTQVFEMPAEDWLAQTDMADLRRWAGEGKGLAAASIRFLIDRDRGHQGYDKCSALPELDAETVRDKLDSSEAQTFIAQPQWNGHCHETTPLTRQLSHPLIRACHRQYRYRLLTRWLARLVELAQLPAMIESGLSRIQRTDDRVATDQINRGIAMVEAARGRLIHRATVKDDLVTDYQILAPTEWNFHPDGVLSQNLMNIRLSSDQNDRLARLMINAIDPCVGYQLRIH